jgi:hypothetical protein
MCSSSLTSFSALWGCPGLIKFTKVRAIGMPIMIKDTGEGISLLKILTIKIPIEEAEKAVNV